MTDAVDNTKDVSVNEEVATTNVEEKATEKVENGDKATSNGEAKEESNEAEAEAESESPAKEDAETKPAEKPSAKRKSTGGGDATDNALKPTPEKKAKVVEESAEAESNTEEVAA